MSARGWEGKRSRARWSGRGAVGLALVVMGASPAGLAAQSLLDRRAGVTFEDQPVEAALRLLQRTAGVRLAYSPDLLPADRLVSCSCTDVTVARALDSILENSGLTYRAGGSLIRIVALETASGEAESGFIAGQVLDSESRVPVANIMVQVEGGPGVLSRADGSFFIEGIPSGTRRLVVTGIGWQRQLVDSVVVTSADTTLLTLRIRPSAIPLEELLVAPGSFRMLEDVHPGTVRTLTREEMETLPQFAEDVFRGLKRLPGVASHDISTKLSVRGGLDREVAVRLDGMELYEPYHMKDWDGALGIVDLNALGGIELTAGGFGAEYGDKLTGVLDMVTRTSVDSARMAAGLGISSVSVSGDGGFADQNGAWLVSARRGFMDLVLKLIGEDQRLSPSYYDVFGKVRYQVSPRHLLSAHVLQAGDEFKLADRPTEGIDEVDLRTGWDSSYAWLTWDAFPGAELSGRTMAWTGRVTRRRRGFVVDGGRVGMPERMIVNDDRVFTFAGLRHDLSYELSPDVLLKVGAEARFGRADYDYASHSYSAILTPEGERGLRLDTVGVALEPSGHSIGLYASSRFRPVDRFTAEVGLRYDRVSHTDDRDLSPRVLAAFDLAPHTKLRASWGRYYQSHGLQELQVGDGETTYHPSERADQVAVGLEHLLRNGVDLRVELYRRQMADPSPRFINLEQELNIFPELEGDRLRLDPIRGRAAGLELSAERRTGRNWAWSVSYALAIAEDELPEDSPLPCAGEPPCEGGSWIPRQYDQRHTFRAQLAYRPNPRLNLSWSWTYHSGWPATAWTFQAVRLDDGSVFWSRTFGPLRGVRLPSYQRLDFRVTRDFQVRGRPLHVYLDLFNVLDRTNLAAFAYEGTFENGRVYTERQNGQELLPRLPTIGFRYEF